MKMHGKFETVASNSEAIMQKIEAEKAVRIDPESFRGHPRVLDADLDKDLAKVEQKKNRIDSESSEDENIDEEVRITSKIAEHVIGESIKNGNWFGDKAQVIIPSLYDDYFRGADLITQFVEGQNDSTEMSLSFDFTITKDGIAKKMLGTFSRLQKGIIPAVKYFDSPVTGKRVNVWMPQVILSADYSRLQEMKDNYVELLLSGDPEAAKKALENNPVQYVFLDEIRAQLNAYSNICYEFLKNEKAGKLYYRASKIFEAILAQKGIDFDRLKKEGRGDGAHQKMVSLIGKYDRPRPTK